MNWVQIVGFDGILVGTAVVTLLWTLHVSHRPKGGHAPPPAAPIAQTGKHLADDVLTAARSKAAMTREMASYAAALGSSTRKSWH
jgi:hypothetical protein